MTHEDATYEMRSHYSPRLQHHADHSGEAELDGPGAGGTWPDLSVQIDGVELEGPPGMEGEIGPAPVPVRVIKGERTGDA